MATAAPDEVLEPTALDECMALWQRDGELRQEAVLAAARNPASVLHGAFEWDDSAAAEQYRLIQAARLIRRFYLTLEVVEDGKPRRLRAFLNTSKGYQPTPTVMSNKRLREEVLARMRSEVEVMAARYERYSSIVEVGEFTKQLRRWLKDHT